MCHQGPTALRVRASVRQTAAPDILLLSHFVDERTEDEELSVQLPCLQMSLFHSRALKMQHSTHGHCWLFVSVSPEGQRRTTSSAACAASAIPAPTTRLPGLRYVHCTIRFGSHYALVLENKELMVGFFTLGPHKAAKGQAESLGKSERTIFPGIQ